MNGNNSLRYLQFREGAFDFQTSQQNPLAKRMGKIEDVTNLVMFLLSEESSYIWGENIYINGGML
ncbi:SDR family oxidoreductase [Lactococcus lactis subsp. lactis]|nr:SDR family oxidoreductase [Lactococcus lactis subsp. lactis]